MLLFLKFEKNIFLLLVSNFLKWNISNYNFVRFNFSLANKNEPKQCFLIKLIDVYTCSSVAMFQFVGIEPSWTIVRLNLFLWKNIKIRIKLCVLNWHWKRRIKFTKRFINSTENSNKTWKESWIEANSSLIYLWILP